MRAAARELAREDQRATRRLLLWLLLAAVGLSATSLVLLRVTPLDALRDPSAPLVQLLDVRSEQNLPTWFSVAVLSAAAWAHAVVGQLARRCRRPSAPWYAVAVLAASLSLDEAASLHEQLAPLGRALGGGSGLTHFAWLVPGAVMGVVLVVAAVACTRALPPASALLVPSGVTLLVGAAVLLEAVGGQVLAAVGDGPAYIVVSHVEELLETVGACLLLAGAAAGVRVTPTGPGVAVALRQPEVRTSS